MKLSMEDILLINAFEKVSQVTPKDCIVKDNTISYLVKEKDMGKAIGKNAINVKQLEKALNKRIEIIGFYEKPEDVLSKTFQIKINEAKTKNKKLLLNVNAIDRKKFLLIAEDLE